MKLKIFLINNLLKDGEIVLYENVEELRFQRGKAVTDVFKEVFSR